MNRMTVKELRLTRNVTQEELSKRAGVSIQAISSWESGKRKISDLSRYKVAAFFGVDPDLIKTEVKDE